MPTVIDYANVSACSLIDFQQLAIYSRSNWVTHHFARSLYSPSVLVMFVQKISITRDPTARVINNSEPFADRQRTWSRLLGVRGVSRWGRSLHSPVVRTGSMSKRQSVRQWACPLSDVCRPAREEIDLLILLRHNRLALMVETNPLLLAPAVSAIVIYVDRTVMIACLVSI